jgi:hypothetical protein
MKRFAGSAVAPVIVAAAVFGTAALSVTAGRPFEDMSKATTVSHGATTTAARVPAKTLGWRVVAKVGPYGGQVSGTLTAGTPKAAWSVWTGQGFTAVDRWNGSAWRQVAVPAKLISAVRSAVAFDGNTTGNFWLFNSSHPVQALRYSGTTWATQRIPSWALRKQARGGYDVVTKVFGSYADSRVWVFSLNAGAYAAHYNGHAWHKETLPETPLAVDVDASNDIWAVGAREIMHWNPFNGGWHTMSLPPMPPGGGILPEGSIQYTQLTAASPADVWLVGQITATAGPARNVWFAQHWNGKSWGFNVAPTNFAGSVAPDGHGGLWADSIDANPGGFWLLGHLSGGHWTGVRPPAGVWSQSPLTLTWITGSRSLWATAQSIGTRGTKALILKYGR